MSIWALVLGVLCASVLGFFALQPASAHAQEGDTGSEIETQNLNDPEYGNEVVTDVVPKETLDTPPTATTNGSTTTNGSATTNESANTTPPTTTPAQPEDPNKYLKDSAGKVIKGAGWHKIGNNWYYTNAEGVLAKGYQTVGGVKYYLDPTTGVMATGWKTIDGNKYYFNGSGAITKGWQKLGGTWYYLNPSNNVLMTGWQPISGKTYYLDAAKNGAMSVAWAKADDGKWHYFGGANDGSVKTGWIKLGSWYYLDPANKGAMYSGKQKVNGKWYYFGGAEDGAMKSGWQKINNEYYFFNGPNDGSMKTGWLLRGRTWYYLMPTDGVMARGEKQINGKWYYFGPNLEDGAMKYDWQQIPDSKDNNKKKWYYFGGANDGSRKTGWIKGAYWYYLDPANNGAMVEEDKVMPINGKWYSFQANGAMRSNTRIKRNGDECWYAASSGELTKIGKYDGDKVILQDSNGNALSAGWHKVAGVWFYTDNSGVPQTGWLSQGGTWYYLMPSSGAMATGSAKVDGVMNYFEASGAWNAEKTNMVKRAQGFSSRTNYLVLVDVNACRVGVFNGSQGNWNLVRYEPCVCGAPGSPTIRGTYSTGYHLGNLPSWSNARYCTNIVGGYFFHSILNSTSELGGHLSHGCVRLNWPYAQYIQTLPYGSTVNLY